MKSISTIPSFTTIPTRATTPTKAMKLKVSRVSIRPVTTPIMESGTVKRITKGCLKESNWAVRTKKIRIRPRNITRVMD